MKRIILAILVCFMSLTALVAQGVSSKGQNKKEVYIPKLKIKGSKLKNKKIYLKVDGEKYLIKKDTIISGIKVRKKAIVVNIDINDTQKDVALIVDGEEMVLSGKNTIEKNVYYRNGERTEIERLSEVDADDIVAVTIKTDDNDETKSFIMVNDKEQKGKKGNLIIVRNNGKVTENAPLIVVNDKIQDQNYNLKELSPDTIKEITVLKGEKAKARYGEKGENGVILITTKK